MAGRPAPSSTAYLAGERPEKGPPRAPRPRGGDGRILRSPLPPQKHPPKRPAHTPPALPCGFEETRLVVAEKTQSSEVSTAADEISMGPRGPEKSPSVPVSRHCSSSLPPSCPSEHPALLPPSCPSEHPALLPPPTPPDAPPVANLFHWPPVAPSFVDFRPPPSNSWLRPVVPTGWGQTRRLVPKGGQRNGAVLCAAADVWVERPVDLLIPG
eukprot:Hpha_TRINITY_DN2143_c0_g1::TRINITY_DN2143_c0_g1_i1::g.42374::m.42374